MQAMEKQTSFILDKKVKTVFSSVLIAMATLLSYSALKADDPGWIKSTVNSNFYVLTPNMTWQNAEQWARDWGGHLVTVRNREEELWIREVFGTDQQLWIGYNVIGRTHDVDNFYWSSGETPAYTNWAEGEPSNSGGNEDAVVMNDDPNLDIPLGGDAWNDLPSHLDPNGVAEIKISDNSVGLVVETYGDVDVTVSNGYKDDAVSKGYLLKSGDVIETYQNSLLNCIMVAVQGSRTVDIKPDSEVKISDDSTSEKITIEFFKGEFRSILENLPDDYFFEVITPHAVIGVRGTDFTIKGNESYTEVKVYQGSVEVSILDGTQSVIVEEDHMLEVTDPDEELGVPVSFEYDELFGGGSGTENNPWLIETAEHLNNVRNLLGQDYQDIHFRQISDINLDQSPWNEGEGWIPIGTKDESFFGNYDGNGMIINNLLIDRNTTEYQGLFGCNNGTILNLGVVNASVTDHGSRAGILVGLNASGHIGNCYTSGSIQSDHEDGRIGGLTGWNYSVITDSYSSAMVSAKGILAGGLSGANSGGSIIKSHATGDVNTESIQAGGLVGQNQGGGIITECFATGKIYGSSYIGGLLGSNMGENSSVEKCYSLAEVSGGEGVGGLVGVLVFSSKITDSYSEGEVAATGNWVGGLVGLSRDNTYISSSYSASNVSAGGYSVGGLCGSIESNSMVENTYANGDVSGQDWAGGLIGWVENSEITNSYSTGQVSLTEPENNAGGLTGGSSHAGTTNSFWDIQTSGQSSSTEGVGKTTTELLSQATFSGWDFGSIWFIEDGVTYPFLQWQEEPADHNHPGSFTLSLQVNSPGYGSVEGGGDYVAGEFVSISATPDEGFQFINWTLDGTFMSTRRTLLLPMPPQNITITANFQECSPEGEEWISGGPGGGYVTCLEFARSDPGVIYAGTTSGVYRSADNGETWTFAGLRGIAINDISADPEDEDLLYAAAGKIPGYFADINDGFYKSTDGGDTWEKTYHTWVTAIGVDYGNPGTVYFGTKSGEIFKSFDKGDNWELIHTEDSGEFMVQINTILVDPEDSSNIFAGTGSAKYAWSGYRGFLKSTDGGQTWSGIQLGTTSPDKGIELVVTPEGYSPQTLYIISDGHEGIGSDYSDIVYYSTDKGDTWTGLYIPAYSEYRSARTLSVDQKDPAWVVIGTNNPDHPLIAASYLEGIFADISDGLPWREASCIASSPNSMDVGFVGYNDGKTYRTENHAESWHLSGKGLDNAMILDIEVNPLQSETAHVAIEGFFPLQKTDDGGMSWIDLAPHFVENFTSIAIDPDDPDRMFIGSCGGNDSGKIYTSDDGGASGVRVDENSMSGRVKDLWIHPGNPDTILALKYYRDSYAGGVRRSIDGGSTWEQTYNWDWPVCLASDPADPDIVYMGVERIGYIFRSSDAGATWTNITPGDRWYNIYGMTVDAESNLLIASSGYEGNSMGGIWKWDGAVWTRLFQLEYSGMRAIEADNSTNPPTLYAGTEHAGVFRSLDKGVSWEPFNNKLGVMEISRLKVSHSEPLILYAGTINGGIWRLPLGMESFIINAQAGENGSIYPSGDVEVQFGHDQSFTITPENNYKIASIAVDGSTISLETDENWDANMNQYTFANVTGNHSIEAGFELTINTDVIRTNEFRVYPNPALRELWIEFRNEGSTSAIILFNPKGQVMKHLPVREMGPARKNISTENLSPGIYFLTISGKQAFPVKKIIIAKP